MSAPAFGDAEARRQFCEAMHGLRDDVVEAFWLAAILNAKGERIRFDGPDFARRHDLYRWLRAALRRAGMDQEAADDASTAMLYAPYPTMVVNVSRQVDLAASIAALFARLAEVEARAE